MKKLPASIKTDQLPETAKWLAQDADGTWWAFEVEPLCFDKGWYENELGNCWRLVATEKPDDFRTCLINLELVRDQQ